MTTTTAVVDASTLLDALLPGEQTDPVRACLAKVGELAAPEHLGVEVLNVLRRLDRGAKHPRPSLTTARRTLAELRITHVPLALLHERIWALRDNLTAYDAAYLAAAEHLYAPLLTSDTALLNHPDAHCAVSDPRYGPAS